jgi:HSP20 family molecular chaperone IbpA
MKSQRASKPKSHPPAVRLSPSNPADLQPKMQKVQLAIARRAHELFEARGGEHGRDLEDWFRAECELLSPVSLSMSESRNEISVRASVDGFNENELEVSIEPHRITILGNNETSGMKAERGTIEQAGSYPHQILQVVHLSTEVIPERAVVELQAGVLKIELPAAATNEFATAPAA